MLQNNEFNGKNILITGAGSGIGRATAILLSDLGANIILVGRTKEKLKATATKLNSYEIIEFDVCNFQMYDSLFAQIACKLDGLVHCAGIAFPIPLKVFSEKNISNVMNTNFISFAMLLKYFSKKKYSNDGASIVACSSINAHYPQKCMSIYEASKYAVEGCVRGIADELYNPRKIRINSMVIGPIATPMAGIDDDSICIADVIGSHSEITPNLMGMGSPQYVAMMAAFLLSDMSIYSTGRNFFVDGGRL